MSEIENLCCACLLITDEPMPIFNVDKVTLKLYSDMFEECTGITYSKDKGQPRNLCKPCVISLNAAWHFIDVCKSSNQRFKTSIQHGDEAPTNNLDCLFIKEEIETAKEFDADYLSVKSENDDLIDNETPNEEDSRYEATVNSLENNKVDNNNSSVKMKIRKIKPSKRCKVSAEKIKCPKCEHVATSECRFKKHLKSYHAEILDEYLIYPCKVCGKIFKRKTGLKVHTRIHSGVKPFSCEFCPMKFSQSGSLIDHRRSHTGETPFVCKICSKVFSSRSSFWRHARVHTNEKPFACELCGRRFAQHATLKQHKLVHTEDRPYLCHVCDKATKSKYGMEQHMLTHMDKKCVCEYCGKKFANLKAHMSKMHSDVAGWCEYCSRDISNLAQHMNIHSEIPNYQCNECRRTFRWKSSLSFHLYLHFNADKHKCAFDKCGKGFPKANQLDFHIRKCHSHENAFLCKICKKGFFRSCDLTKHMTNFHSYEMIVVKKKIKNPDINFKNILNKV